MQRSRLLPRQLQDSGAWALGPRAASSLRISTCLLAGDAGLEDDIASCTHLRRLSSSRPTFIQHTRTGVGCKPLVRSSVVGHCVWRHLAQDMRGEMWRRQSFRTNRSDDGVQSKAVKRHKMALGSDHLRLASPRASRLPSLPSPCAASSHGPTWSDHSSAPVYRNSTLCNQTHLVFCIHHNLALSRPPRSRSRTYSRDLDAFNSLSGPHSR